MCQNCVSLNAGDLLTIDEPFLLNFQLQDATDEALAGVGPEKVRVSLGPKYKRKEYTGDPIIDIKWKQCCEDYPELADRQTFRFAGGTWVDDGRAVSVELGVSSLKEYVGSNRLDVAMRQMRKQAGMQNENDYNAYFANCVGCESVVVTSDQKSVLLWKSPENVKYPFNVMNCNRFKSKDGGRFSGTNALPDPARLGLDGSQEADAATQGRVSRELFDAALRGVQEELGIPRDQLSVPRLIGCMTDSRHYKPELLFVVHTSLDAAGVRKVCEAARGGEGECELDFWPYDSLPGCPLPCSCALRALCGCCEAYRAAAGSAPVFGEFPPAAAEAEAAAPAAPVSAVPHGAALAPDTAPAKGDNGASDDAPAAAAGRPAPTWIVVGGTPEKGILVRKGKPLTSVELKRLAHGARIEELDLQGDRLHFRKLEGEGPEEGWVSIALNGKELTRRE